jgi:DNA relaxase NicK
LTVSISDFTIDDVVDMLLSANIEYLESRNAGNTFYRSSYLFTHGVRLFMDPTAENMPHLSLAINGEACRTLSLEQVAEIAALGTPSRIDVALDHDEFTAREAATWVRAGYIRTRARSKQFYEDLVDSDAPQDTLYIGKRTSDQFTRIYDQRHKEERLYTTRLELEMKGDVARGFWAELCMRGLDEFVGLALGAITHHVDFVNTNTDTNTTRAPRLSAWSQLVGNVERVRVRLASQAITSAEKVATWAYNYLSAIITAAHDAGALDFDELLTIGRRKRKRRHTLIAAGFAV